MGERESVVGSEESLMACYQTTVDDVFRYAGILCGTDRAAAEVATQGAHFSTSPIETGILQGPSFEGDYVSVAPWDKAFFTSMSAGYEQLMLVDPSGYVALWTNGLDRATLIDIARSLRSRGTAGG